MVLPTVATSTAGQNSSGLSLISPNTAGSLPNGSSVAEISETTNTVLRPNFGSASASSKVCNQASIAAIIDNGPSLYCGLPASPIPGIPHEDRLDRAAEQSVRRADGGRHRPAVPPAVQAARRRLRGERDGH